MPQQDPRARLQPKDISRAQTILGPHSTDNILYPLYSTNGVLFPYTPSVQTGSTAEYDNTPFVHTNYAYNNYIRSSPKEISITAEFTAQSNDEALYLLAVIHFFRSITKSYFGISPYNRAGTPPPVLIFTYLGEYQFNNVPVVVKSFDYTLPNNIDYVAVDTTGVKAIYSENIGTNIAASSSGGFTWVPVQLSVSLNLDTQYIPIKIRNEFNLDDFRKGKLFNKGFI